MTSIFDSDIGEGRAIQQSIAEPSITPQSRGASVNINPEDTYNLAGSRRITQLKEQAAAKKQARLAQQQAQAAAQAEADNLNGIINGLKSKYDEIDSRVTNPIEANRLKREARFSAMAAGGKANSSYIKSLADTLDTKRQVREDGMIEVIDGQGRVVGISGGSADSIRAERQNRYIQKIDEVLPETIDSLQNLIDIDTSTGGEYIQESTVNSIIGNFKNEAGRMKRISEDYHMKANQVPSSQFNKLQANAKREYINSISSVYKEFASEDMLKAIKSGRSFSRSDLQIAMERVGRDIMNEVRENKVPVNLNDIQEFIKTTKDDLNDMYDSIQKTDNFTIEQQKIKYENLNSLQKAKRRNELNLGKLEADKEVLSFYATAASVTKDMVSSAADLEFDTSPEGQELRRELLAGGNQMMNAMVGVTPLVNQINSDLYETTFSIDNFQASIKTAKTREDFQRLGDTAKRLSNLSKNWILSPVIGKVFNEQLKPVVENTEELNDSEKERMLNAIGAYTQTSEEIMNSRPNLKEDTQGFLSKFWDHTFGSAGSSGRALANILGAGKVDLNKEEPRRGRRSEDN